MSADETLNANQFGHLYHGSRAQLSAGDYIESGHGDNYPEANQGADFDIDKVGKVYATPSRSKAAMFAYQAKGSGTPRVYQVTNTGPMQWDEETSPEDYESDAQMNRKGSRRSAYPLQVIGEMRSSRSAEDVRLQARMSRS